MKAKAFGGFSRGRSLAFALGAGVLGAAGVAQAGRGATYETLTQAIASENVDTIVAEVERGEKRICGACVGVVRGLIDHPSGRVRDVAAWWLAKRAIRAKVQEEMVARLESGSPAEARNAAEVLGRFGRVEALPALEGAIYEERLGDEARGAAARAIGRIGDAQAKPILEAALRSESGVVRAAAAASLRGLRHNPDGVALVETLRDDEDTVVREAALSVGVLREVAAVPALIDVVTDETRPPLVRRDAAWALGRIRDGAAHSRRVLLEVAKHDSSVLVRGAARVAARDLR